jgi:hypothetical protein
MKSKRRAVGGWGLTGSGFGSLFTRIVYTENRRLITKSNLQDTDPRLGGDPLGFWLPGTDGPPKIAIASSLKFLA